MRILETPALRARAKQSEVPVKNDAWMGVDRENPLTDGAQRR